MINDADSSVKDSVTSFTNSFHNLIDSMSVSLDGADDAEGLNVVIQAETPTLYG